MVLFDRFKPLTEIMKIVRQQNNEDASKNYMNCNHNNALDGTLRGFSRANFRAKASISVMFVNDHGDRPEFGIDNSGPSREYSRFIFYNIYRYLVIWM